MFPPDKISTLYPPIVVRGQDAKCAHCRPYACLVAPVVMIHDEHSAARGGGFDLRRIAPSSDDLVQLAMRAFKIDPNASDARQRLSCELRRKKRKGRIGRRNDDLRLLIAIERRRFTTMEPKGELSSRTATEIAKWIAPFFLNITETSLIRKVRRWKRNERAGKLRV